MRWCGQSKPWPSFLTVSMIDLRLHDPQMCIWANSPMVGSKNTHHLQIRMSPWCLGGSTSWQGLEVAKESAWVWELEQKRTRGGKGQRSIQEMYQRDKATKSLCNKCSWPWRAGKTRLAQQERLAHTSG